MSTFEDELRENIKAIGDRAAPTDLLERSLQTAHGLRRRRTTATAGAIAIAVTALAIGGWAIGPGHHNGSIQPIVTPTPSVSPPTSQPPPTATSTPSTVTAPVASCPIPVADFAGTPYSPESALSSLTVPVSLKLPPGAQIFGAKFPEATAGSYLIGPKSAICRGEFLSADFGMLMSVGAANLSDSVRMVLRAGGAGASTDLACPYIRAVRTADESFRKDVPNSSICSRPAGDVVQQIPTLTADLYAAVVRVPATVNDPNWPIQLRGSTSVQAKNPTLALYTAQVFGNQADAQVIACTLPMTQQDICIASLKLFLAKDSEIASRIDAAQLEKMENAISVFVAGTAP
jgi:hypothetical protein